MEDFQKMFTRYRKYIFSLLSIYVLGFGFTEYQPVFLGLILGTVISLYNLFVMVRKSKRFDKAFEEGKKVGSLGTLSRMASAGLAVVIALQYPDQIHLVSVVLGLMTSYIVIMIDFFFQKLS
ncbi:ATP synthase subunit I [Cytobacillus sp. S13-E01]|uniref:ATP synthase subunit I n=1 Tax=Cytobacillus sp. S13-E01 TaxID=3031326 RepID=UPI0023D84474|nr:ATP synthase subunit I [Cytobacillus sp. S13-E01]MDF0726613.1 ATP synthase subunit I [Cytobacillus sp. S13-E01]